MIHEGSFLLADEAKTGTYTIQVTGKSYVSCTFSVEEYVLPKFGVEIEGSSTPHLADKFCEKMSEDFCRQNLNQTTDYLPIYVHIGP